MRFPRRFALALGLLVVGPPSYAADWRLVGVAGGTRQEFDASTIKRQSGSTITVWTKTVPSEKAIAEIRAKPPQYGAHMRNYSHALSLQAVNCDDKSTGLSGIIFYDKSGNVIDEAWVPPAEIILKVAAPETLGDALVKVICAQSFFR